ncbi:MAG: nitroreductase [Chloroflexi bacterium]|nr:nitroreductase [Chloroflexota bacterium]
MDVIKALNSRRSIRGFKKDPVPKDVIHKILEAAVRTPSGMNTQPWEFVVASGKVLDEIREECSKLFNEGSFPTNDMLRKPYEGIYRQRQVDLAMEIFKIIGISREDKEARKKWMLRGFRFFDSPCQIVICAEKEMQYHLDMLGIGAMCQSICLAALDFGLGTCIADQGIMYDQVWRKHAGIPETKRLIAGITIGYPDEGFAVNKMITPREPVDKITTWLGF